MVAAIDIGSEELNVTNWIWTASPGQSNRTSTASIATSSALTPMIRAFRDFALLAVFAGLQVFSRPDDTVTLRICRVEFASPRHSIAQLCTDERYVVHARSNSHKTLIGDGIIRPMG